jgi:hypothetical protein
MTPYPFSSTFAYETEGTMAAPVFSMSVRMERQAHRFPHLHIHLTHTQLIRDRPIDRQTTTAHTNEQWLPRH